MNPDEGANISFIELKLLIAPVDAARLLSDNGFYNSAINRLYYSLFYAVNALLFSNEIYSISFWMKSQFSLHFIKSEKLDKK